MPMMSRDLGGRDRLVIDHVGLVKTVASRLARRLPSQVEIADLIGVGVLGLIEAAERYQPALGVPFDAFARRRLQGAMLDALRDIDLAPRSARRLRRELESTMGALRHQLGREPEEAEIAAAMGLGPQEYARALDQMRVLEAGCVQQLDDEGGDGGVLEWRQDPDEGPEARLQRAELRTHLASALSGLPERERQILALYYDEDLTLAEIGEVFGISESRVSQLRSLALSRLRTRLRASMSGAENHR
jgi:RNA polymerase sigma factor FliA